MAKKQNPSHMQDIWNSTSEIEDLLFAVPGANEIGDLAQPDQQLAEMFRTLRADSSKNLIRFAILADAVRTANQNQKQTLNANFHSWYAKFNMDKVFGRKSTFYKYAEAGKVLLKFKTDFHESFHKLPFEISALYAIAEMTDEEIALAVKDHYLKDPESHATVIGTSKSPQPVINPNATALSITRWLKHWRNPPVSSTERRRVPLLSINAHESIFDFDKHGNQVGQTTFEDIDRIYHKIIDILHDENKHVLVCHRLFEVKKEYERRRFSALDKASKNIESEIEVEILRERITVGLWAIVRDHQTHQCLPQGIKRWKKLKEQVVSLSKIAPNLFEANAAPTLSFIDASNLPSTATEAAAHWVVGERIYTSGDEYAAANRDPKTCSIDISSLVSGANKGTFVVFENFLDAKGDYFTDQSIYTNYKSASQSDLIALNMTYLALRRKISELKGRSNLRGTVMKLKRHDGSRLEFIIGDENYKLYDYYRDLKRLIIEK
jgi:hypothetical protein